MTDLVIELGERQPYLEVLATLARSAAVSLRVVGAYRDTEVGSQDRLSVLLADLGHAGLARQHTLGPLAWLITVTMTAGTQLVFSSDPKLGFFARAAALAGSADPSAGQRIANFYLDAGITLFFMAVVAMLVFTSAREWWLVLSRRKPAIIHEARYVPTTLVAGD